MNNKLSVCSVIITYYPNVKHLLSMSETLNEQGCRVIIVDNTPECISLSIPNVDIIYQGYNSGIAEAQNVGLRYSIKKGYEYTLLLDQDSKIPDHFVYNLTNKIKNMPDAACIGPRVFDLNQKSIMTAKLMKNDKFKYNTTKVSQIIASGQLINNSVLDTIGLMESELFIDAVDHEWCWRASSYGYSIYIDEDTIMEHVLGESSKKILFFRLTKNNPIRLYYITRNYFLLIRRGYVPFYWKIRNLIILPIASLLGFIFFDKKKERLIYTLKGFFDGILNKNSIK